MAFSALFSIIYMHIFLLFADTLPFQYAAPRREPRTLLMRFATYGVRELRGTKIAIIISGRYTASSIFIAASVESATEEEAAIFLLYFRLYR